MFHNFLLLLLAVSLLKGSQSQVLVSIAPIGNGEHVLLRKSAALVRGQAVSAAPGRDNASLVLLLLVARQHLHNTFVASTGQKLLGRMRSDHLLLLTGKEGTRFVLLNSEQFIALGRGHIVLVMNVMVVMNVMAHAGRSACAAAADCEVGGVVALVAVDGLRVGHHAGGDLADARR